MSTFAAATSCAVVLLIAASNLASQTAEARAITHNLSIPSQSLGDALKALSAAADEQLLFSSQLVAGKQSADVDGQYTTDQALEILLQGSGLKADRTPSGVLLIRSEESTRPAASAARPTADVTSSVEREASFRKATEETSKNEAGDKNKNDGETLEEVLVTAQKREERLRDVPISITALSGDDLDHGTSGGVADAINRVPGVSVTTGYLGGGSQLAVRGVTAAGPQGAGSSPVGYYLDSVPFGMIRTAFVPDTNAYDLERVEILRGPQGTLYGASAQNGVVRVLTKDAHLDRFEFKARAGGSDTQQGGSGSYRADAAVNVPIIEDKLAARAVIGYESLSGWLNKPNEKQTNDAQLRNLRLKINAQPTDQLSLAASAWSSRNDYGAPSIGRPDGTQNSLTHEPIEIDFDAYGLKAGYQFPRFSLTSMTSYMDYTNDAFLDYLGLGLANTGFHARANATVFAQEFNLNSSDEGPWRWSAGAIYRRATELTNVFRSLYDRVTASPGYVVPGIDKITSESYAVFGELTRLLMDGRVEVKGGLRYFNDDVVSDELQRRNNAPSSQLTHAKGSFDALSPRAVLAWHPQRDQTVYASYAEGFRSGFPQVPATVLQAPQFRPLGADTLKTYELGTKLSLADGRLSIDAATYYQDWTDVQQVLSIDIGGSAANPVRVSAFVNGQSASGPGFEMALVGMPIERLQLGASYTWNDLTMDAAVLSGGVVLFPKGSRLQYSPQETVSAFGEYRIPFSAGYDGAASISATYTSEQQVRSIASGAAVVATGDEMLIGSASFTINAPTNWSVRLFVDNLTNANRTALRQWFGAAAYDSRIRPRTFGAQFEYRLAH